MKVDALLTWPTQADFPLFRYNLARFGKYFNQVYIALSNHYMDCDLTDFIRSHVNAVFITPDNKYPDWRQNAVRALVQSSHERLLLFLEQDFLIKDERFFIRLWDKVKTNHYQFVGYRERERIHPAFCIVDKTLLCATSRDFSAYPDKGMDHFGLFFKEIENLVDFRNIEGFGFKEGKDYLHMAGHTQNFLCHKQAQPFYKPNEFLSYIQYVNRLDIDKDPQFDKLCKEIESKYPKEDNETIRSFFPDL